MTWGERIMSFGGVLTGCAATIAFLTGFIKEELRGGGNFREKASPALLRTSFWAGVFTVAGLATVSIGAFVYFVIEGGVS